MIVSRILAGFGLVVGLALIASPAKADWYEASSDRFVIYADDSAKDLKRYAENLERYHSAMEFITGRKVAKPSPSNRVVIFVVGNSRQVREIAGNDSKYVAGFYIPRAGGSRAFVQDIRNKNGYPDFSTIVLLHEYAHHFLISSSRYPMPRWMSEGAAEFFAAATFNKDGGVLIGRPALHRAGELARAESVSIYELLDQELYAKNKGKRYDAFYGQSWLLYHYLTFNEDRKGQLTNFWVEFLNNPSPIGAAEKIFGDLKQLEKELKAYQRERRMFSYELKPEWLTSGSVSIRPLSDGEAEMMPLRMRSQRGVTKEQALELLPEVRKVAAEYPDDAAVLAALAEAEHDAGNDAQAIAAADKAIALNPALTNPYVQKGYSLFRMAAEADKNDGSAYEAAMKPFTQLNKLENDHPIPLIYYYRSFAERGVEPPERAKHALERAALLAPFDKGLWFNVATMQMQEGKIAIAIASLKPLAADPHGGAGAAQAEALLEMLSKAPEGQPVSMRDSPIREDPETPAQDSDGEGEGEGEGKTDEGDEDRDPKASSAPASDSRISRKFR